MKNDFRIEKLAKKALEVKKVAEQLKEYGYTNLKVHDIFYHVDYSGEMRNIVDDFLEEQLDVFQKKYDYFIHACNECIAVYKYIDYFKENQYKIFKKYLEDNYTQLGYFYNGLCSIPVYQSIFENDNNIMYLWNQGGDKEQFSTSEIKYQLGFSEEDERVIEKQLNTIGNHINIDNIDVREYINIGNARFYFDECMAVGM